LQLTELSTTPWSPSTPEKDQNDSSLPAQVSEIEGAFVNGLKREIVSFVTNKDAGSLWHCPD